MPDASENSDRLVCAVLAAQVAALRDRMADLSAVELIWQTTDLLTRLSALLLEATQHGLSALLTERCVAAVQAEEAMGRSLAAVALDQSQRQDYACQMADCVTTALQRLSATAAPAGGRLSIEDLAALYVSEDQRSVHRAVTGNLEQIWTGIGQQPAVSPANYGSTETGEKSTNQL